MFSEQEILSHLTDARSLSTTLKQNSSGDLADSVYLKIIDHYRNEEINKESLVVARNLYGRMRSTSLSQSETDFYVDVVKKCLRSNCRETKTTFIQYIHNINRLVGDQFRDMAYLCSLLLRETCSIDVLSCVFCAQIDRVQSPSLRFDLIIDSIYGQDGEENVFSADLPVWVKELSKKVIDNDSSWLRSFYLTKHFDADLLNAIDQHKTDEIFREASSRNETCSPKKNSCPTVEFDLDEIQSIDDLHRRLKFLVDQIEPIKSITHRTLLRLFSALDLDNYPRDLHCLFVCSLTSIYQRDNYSSEQLSLFRILLDMINNYYVHQQDMFDDEDYRLTIVHCLSRLMVELNRRRSHSEHVWYKLYVDVPEQHPLPTFNLFSDMLRLLATTCYNHKLCQDQVRLVSGTIEAILSMSQIDLNQPKSQACFTWLIKCLTENNEENREYIRQIRPIAKA